MLKKEHKKVADTFNVITDFDLSEQSYNSMVVSHLIKLSVIDLIQSNTSHSQKFVTQNKPSTLSDLSLSKRYRITPAARFTAAKLYDNKCLSRLTNFA